MMAKNKERTPGGSTNRIAGFTIIELLLATAIAGLVLGAIYAVFISSNRSYRTQDRVVDTQQGLRVGLDFMLRDIRIAGLDPQETGLFSIEQATGSLIQFTTDLNMDGVVDEDSRERIAYQFAGGELKRCNLDTKYQNNPGTPPPDRVPQTWDSLIENVNNLTFQYLDSGGNDLGVPGTNVTVLANIRTVVITMTNQGTDAEGKTFARTLSTRVRGRNL